MTNLAVVVGIAAHVKPHLNLRSPENDARALASILAEDHGYDLMLRCNEEATRERLLELFQREIAAKVRADTNLVVYFAGHGLVIDSLSRPMGYLVPHDGDDDESTLLPMDAVYAGLEELPCKHVLVILDCCFAGAFRWGQHRDSLSVRAPELYRERYELFLRRPAWQLITSAAADEKAADVLAGMAYGVRREAAINSPFLDALLRGLRGAADIQPPGGDGVVTATELYLFLRQEIERMDDYKQTPGLWTLARHEQGEFVFHVPGRELALPSAPELARENCPYRGLEPYSEKDREWLFGRDRALEQLVERVQAEALTVVVAPSGAGKSSVVRAGLVPRYRDAHPGASVIVTRPSQRDNDAIADAVEQVGVTGSSLLVIDQLEELLALERDAGSRDTYLTAIAQALDSGVRIVATLRSDFEPQFAATLLRDRWQKARFALADMTREELREAIEGPATRAVLFFEPPALVDRLVDAVVGTPGALPLLSVLLSRMHERLVIRADNERLLLESDFEALGGIAGALRERLDELHEQLDAPTQEMLRAVFMRMIEIDGGTIVRRPVRAEELDFGDPLRNAGVRQVWQRLTAPEARLATASGDDHNQRLELVHDAVIRSWPRFDEWIRDRDAVEDLRLERRIATAEHEWRQRHDPRLLWHADPRLDLAVRLGEKPVGLNRREREFVVASIRKRRQGKLIAALTTAVVLAGIGSLGVTIWLQDQAGKRLEAAEKRRAIGEDGAKARLLAGVPGKQDESLLRGIHAVHNALQMGDEVPPAAMDGLVAAIAAEGQLLFHEIRHHGDFSRVGVACTSDGDHVLSTSP